jgi:hypothetical protein
MMKHYYQNIEGWFEQTKLYDLAISKYNNARFVEVGCWKGRSVSYAGVSIINSGKNIKLDVVDTFMGSPEHDKVDAMALYNDFIKNIEPVLPAIGKVHKLSSIEGAKLYEDNSLDFVFIDASHDDANVKADCAAWWPKVKSGGILGGDDYSDSVWPGVVRGVNMYFGNTKIPNTSLLPHWYIIKD